MRFSLTISKEARGINPEEPQLATGAAVAPPTIRHPEADNKLQNHLHPLPAPHKLLNAPTLDPPEAGDVEENDPEATVGPEDPFSSLAKTTMPGAEAPTTTILDPPIHFGTRTRTATLNPEAGLQEGEEDHTP